MLPTFTAPAHWRAIDLISDLHLAENTPRGFEAWAAHLRHTSADAVFILGDLFDAWVGDDLAESGFEARCAEVLSAASERVTLAFMPGNRDFMVGDTMLGSTGVMRLADPTIVTAFGQRVVLAHGDALCLDDVAYQRYRRFVHRPSAQFVFAALPLALRRRIGAALRGHSSRREPRAAGHFIDVDADAALALLREARAPTLVHGHTHAPAGHVLSPEANRLVLSDWELDGSSVPRAEVMRWSAAGFERMAPQAGADRGQHAVSGWWTRWRRGRTLERRAIPEPLWQLTLARYPFLAERGEPKVEKLRELTTLFLAQKEFHGVSGLDVSDEMAVAIASQACLPALELGLEWYEGFVGIVVHADAVVARREIEDDDGIVHAYDEELSGEAMSGGPVMLAWRDVDEAGESAVDGYNVVVHEFAHVIDMRGGVTARLDEVDPASEHGIWLNSLADEYEKFAARIDAGEETFLDPYGAEALEEFFAVASEAFFVAPVELRSEEIRTYALLKSFFRQDPARET